MEEDQEMCPGYDLLKLIGKGSYGRVYEASDQETGVKVAIKKIFNISQILKDVLREIVLLKKLESDHICKIHKVLRP